MAKIEVIPKCTFKFIQYHDEYNIRMEQIPCNLHLKMDGWKTIVSLWESLFSGDMLVSEQLLQVAARLQAVTPTESLLK